MRYNTIAVLGLLSSVILITGCQTMRDKPTSMANPASIYCVNHGGKTFTSKDSQGGEVGYCQLPNNTVVNEWDYYRKNTVAQNEISADNSTLIISYDFGKKAMALQAIKVLDGEIIYDYENFNSFAAKFNSKNINIIKTELERNPSILGVQRKYIQHTTN